MSNIFALCDELGPEKVIHLHNSRAGLQSIVVVDNTAAGPSIGGVRMAPDVTLAECAGLARAMTLKNAAAGLPHGGGKAVISADPAMSTAAKQGLMRAFAKAIKQIEDYIPGPDMGTNETCMGWVTDEIDRAVGLPRVLGGIPLDEIGATGFGLAAAAEVAVDYCDMGLEGARVSIQGFGAVGQNAARFLADKGAILVAVSDSLGSLMDPDGLPLAELIALKSAGKSVTALTGGKAMPDPTSVIGVECDILVPAARPGAIHVGNVNSIRAKLILEGANIPASPEIEAQLHSRRVLVVPDFIANAGGVICASTEYHGGSEAQAMQTIASKIRHNTRAILEDMRNRRVPPRQAAVDLAQTRVSDAMAMRRSFV
ncbi:Glu/Leu/Phe/Val family dehydrogenase [Ruegeria profundi]|uniref:Glutamate dehydrogenase n=1 Tax=Ruegeria profundi TaxID=1685378 RepID=A0A0X3TQ78_9RHOB|nr:Glu/Leu/Phe/Val dehydrogenase [Ruegeria profundi]KUJ77191.1 glutamate dehydrogenase [Ruegeria profundi]